MVVEARWAIKDEADDRINAVKRSNNRFRTPASCDLGGSAVRQLHRLELPRPGCPVGLIVLTVGLLC